MPHCGEEYGGLLKTLNGELPYNPAIPLLGIFPKEMKTLIQNLDVPQCLQQHYLQLPRYGSNLSVHQQMMKEDVVYV